MAVSPVLDAPIMPLEVAQSTESPQSIAQSAADGVPLAGLPPVAEGDGLTFQRVPSIVNGELLMAFEAASNGTANFYLVDGDGAIVAEGSTEISIGALESVAGGIETTGDLTLLVSFETADGRVQALSFPIAVS